MSLQTIYQISYPDTKLFILAGISVICFCICFYLYATMKNTDGAVIVKNAKKLKGLKVPKKGRQFMKVKEEKRVKETPRQQESRRLTSVLDVVRKLEREFNAPVLKQEIIDEGKRQGYSKSQVEESIERLKMDGQIYDPNRNERYKVV